MKFEPKRILVVVDFNECSAAALRLATAIAETFAAALHIRRGQRQARTVDCAAGFVQTTLFAGFAVPVKPRDLHFPRETKLANPNKPRWAALRQTRGGSSSVRIPETTRAAISVQLGAKHLSRHDCDLVQEPVTRANSSHPFLSSNDVHQLTEAAEAAWRLNRSS